MWPDSNIDWSPAREEQAFKVRSALCHIELKGNLTDFAGSNSEKVALLKLFEEQGLVRWSRTRARGELTRAGRKCLRRAANDKLPPWIHGARRRRMAFARVIGTLAATVL